MNKNINELTIEELSFFRDEYIKMFEELVQQNDSILAKLMKSIPDISRFDNVNMTFFGKLAFVAKKLFVNSLASHFLKIDPAYLSNDVGRALTRKGRFQGYLKADAPILAYSMGIELKNGLEKAIEKLRTTDENELRNIIKNMDDAYIDYKSSNVKMDFNSYDRHLIYLLKKYMGTLSTKTYDKAQALAQQDISYGLSMNFFKDLDRIYRTFEENNTKSMGR